MLSVLLGLISGVSFPPFPTFSASGEDLGRGCKRRAGVKYLNMEIRGLGAGLDGRYISVGVGFHPLPAWRVLNTIMGTSISNNDDAGLGCFHL